MKLTVKELRYLMDFIQDKRLERYEESNWYLRNIYDSLSDIKEVLDKSDIEYATQPPEEPEDVPF